LLKQVRTQLLETARPLLEAMLHEITGVKVRETIPDRILDEAERKPPTCRSRLWRDLLAVFPMLGPAIINQHHPARQVASAHGTRDPRDSRHRSKTSAELSLGT